MQNIVTWPYVLRRGHSDNPADGACAMDAVNWLAHGKHGDEPECACPIIGAYVTNGNDNMSNDVRQNLLPYLHRIAGSKSTAHEAARMRILVVAAVRVFVANALEKAGFLEQAKKLRAVSSSVDYRELRSIVSDVVNDVYFHKSLVSAYADSAILGVIDNSIKVIDNANNAITAVNAARSADKAAACSAGWHKYNAVVAATYADAAAVAATYTANVATYAAFAAANAAAVAANMGNITSEMWQPYFDVLDQVLNSGPQGKPWSTDMMDCAVQLYEDAIT